jgi:hypothetical protein
MGIAWGLLLGLFFLARRDGSGTLPPLWAIVTWALLFRVIGLTATPVYEDDYNRFLWDGWVLVTTGNPYQKPPVDFFRDESIPEYLQPILRNVNYPGVPTIYGPVLQYVFGCSTLLSPGSLFTLKCLFLIADLALLVLLSRAASRTSLLLFSWCPLLIFEVSFNAHPDLVGAVLLFGGYLCHLRGRAWWAGALGALAFGAKILAVLAIPLFIWRGGWRAAVAFAGTLLAVYSPFLLQGTSADWDGLRTFATYWEFNSALYAIVHAFFEMRWAKGICYGLFVCAYAIVFFSWIKRSAPEAPLDTMYGLFFLVSPVINAWYLLWLLPFAAMRPRPWSLAAMAAVGLSYATRSNLLGGETSDFSHPIWLRPLEFGIIAVALVAPAVGRALKKPS